MNLEPEPASPDPERLEALRNYWRLPAGLLRRVTCPTLVVHGEADAPVPVALAERIVAAMPNARLEPIPGGGHRPDIRTPELVNPLLLEFLLGGCRDFVVSSTTSEWT